MSTHSITHIHEAHTHNEEIVCSFFRHFDGCPAAHGIELRNWLKNKKLVNGISPSFLIGRDFNRAGSMAVSLMSHIQTISDCEVIPTGHVSPLAEYIYDIYYRNGQFEILINGKNFK